MLLGSYEPSYLGNGRVALPKKIRSEVRENKIVLTIGFEICIFGFGEQTWNEVIRPELEKPFFSDVEARRMRRKMCVNAMVVSIDKQGRIVIPEHMLSYAGIEREISLIGAGDHFEVWDKDAWSRYAKEL